MKTISHRSLCLQIKSFKMTIQMFFIFSHQPLPAIKMFQLSLKNRNTLVYVKAALYFLFTYHPYRSTFKPQREHWSRETGGKLIFQKSILQYLRNDSSTNFTFCGTNVALTNHGKNLFVPVVGGPASRVTSQPGNHCNISEMKAAQTNTNAALMNKPGFLPEFCWRGAE